MNNNVKADIFRVVMFGIKIAIVGLLICAILLAISSENENQIIMAWLTVIGGFALSLLAFIRIKKEIKKVHQF
jgi:hypothetical protein